MPIKWTAALMLGFFIFSLLGGIISGIYSGSHTIQVLENLKDCFSLSEINNPLTAPLVIFMKAVQFFKIIWDILWWNYFPFSGYWVIFQWILRCVSIGLIIALLFALKGTATG